MIIELLLPRSTPRKWHLALAGRLAARPDVLVRVSWADAEEAPPPGLDLLFSLERLIYRVPEILTQKVAWLDFAQFSSGPAAEPDLTLDLCGAGVRKSDRLWTLTFDGQPGETGLLGALLADNLPAIEISDALSGRLIVAARAGSQYANSLLGLFEDLLARASSLIVAAIERRGSAPTLQWTRAIPGTGATVARFAVRAAARRLRRRLYNLCCYAPHWRVGWRFVDGPDVVDLAAHPAAGWRVLPDDGFHFYADPFPVVFQGRSFLFVEDYDHRIGRGVISAVEFDATGPMGSPRPVLTLDVHLSYPFVFEHEGEMWMIVESGENRSVNLYRAENFPDKWRHESTLLADIVAADSTLLQHGGKWWMMATVWEDERGSFSDALHLWSAPAPAGPWTPHRRNPVLIDISSARPAGRVVQRGDRLIRPVQDCRDGYGAALALATITRLDDEAFEQRVDASLTPGPLWPGRRLHTLNRAGRIECIDGSASSVKLLARFRDGVFAGRPARPGFEAVEPPRESPMAPPLVTAPLSPTIGDGRRGHGA